MTDDPEFIDMKLNIAIWEMRRMAHVFGVGSLPSNVLDFLLENGTLKKRLEEAERVIDFYGCIDHYNTESFYILPLIREDNGKKAREYKKKYGVK